MCGEQRRCNGRVARRAADRHACAERAGSAFFISSCIIRDGVIDVGKGLAGEAATDATDIAVLSVAASVAFLRCGDDAPAAIKDEDDVISSLTPSISGSDLAPRCGFWILCRQSTREKSF